MVHICKVFQTVMPQKQKTVLAQSFVYTGTQNLFSSFICLAVPSASTSPVEVNPLGRLTTGQSLARELMEFKCRNNSYMSFANCGFNRIKRFEKKV